MDGTNARTCFDILAELFERDIDMALLKRAQARTPTERIEWLEEMQAFADDARKARDSEAGRAKDLLDLGYIRALRR